MNSQNTPVHIRLWHKDFWLMAFANLLLTMSVYMLIPVFPIWLLGDEGFSPLETGLSMGVFGLGIFAFGGFCSYWVQRFRRNVVCLWAILAQLACLGGVYYVYCLCDNFPIEIGLVLVQRFLLGACFGLAQMVLTSTLVIDTCESYQRTEANHSAAWFSRFALSLGPLASLLLYRFVGFDGVMIGSMACAVASLVLIRLVSFPFRTPGDDIHAFGLDRFFLPQGLTLFLNLMMITTIIGLLMTLDLGYVFYGMMMAGFLLALLCQRFVFRNAEMKSEVASGLILIGAALLMMLSRQHTAVVYVAPTFVGLGIGTIGARFLLFFIKLSRHCQRGTSQSTYMLGWESGLALGMGLGYAFLYGREPMLLSVCLILTIASLLFYNFFTHNWFMRNKNR